MRRAQNEQNVIKTHGWVPEHPTSTVSGRIYGEGRGPLREMALPLCCNTAPGPGGQPPRHGERERPATSWGAEGEVHIHVDNRAPSHPTRS